MRKAWPTRSSGPPSGATCWAVMITHATTCAKAEGLDWRPSDSRGGVDDHRPPTNRERGNQENDDTICERNQSAGGIFHRVDAVQRHRSPGRRKRRSPSWTGVRRRLRCIALLGMNLSNPLVAVGILDAHNR